MTEKTLSAEERADLKAAALLATPGPYELFSGPDGWMIGTSDKAGRVWLNATFHAEPQSADDEANAIFAQLANPSVVFSLLTALEEAEGRLTQVAGTDVWWKTVIGEGETHTPTGDISVKHLHPLTVKPIYEAHKGTVISDVIAGLIFNLAITTNREQFLVSDALDRAQAATARAETAEAALSDARRQIAERDEALKLLDAIKPPCALGCPDKCNHPYGDACCRVRALLANPTEQPEPAGGAKAAGAGHRWSGWPGAWCLDCGAEDLGELALADGWDGETPMPEKYRNGPCPEPGSKRNDPYAAALAPPANGGSE